MAHTHKRPKRQLFKAYIESILFLCNCEIWTMNKYRKKLTKLKKKKNDTNVHFKRKMTRRNYKFKNV